MPTYVGKYLQDTYHLTRAQHGSYLLLLFSYWVRGNLPDDDSLLAQTARCTAKEWRADKPIISQFFSISGGYWKQKRMEEELFKASAKVAAKAEAGAKGAAKRWQSDGTSHTSAIAEKSNSHRQTDAPIPIQEQKKEESPPLIPPEGAKAKRGSSMTEDWQPSEQQIAHCLKKGYSLGQITPVAEHFRDNHLAKGTISKSWDASWRTWITNDIKFHGDPRRRNQGAMGNRPNRGSLVDIVAKLKAEAADEELLSGGRGIPDGGFELRDAADEPRATHGGLANREGIIDADEAERLYRAAGRSAGRDTVNSTIGDRHGNSTAHVREMAGGLSGGCGTARAGPVAQEKPVVASVGGTVCRPGAVQRATQTDAQGSDDGLEIPDFLRRRK